MDDKVRNKYAAMTTAERDFHSRIQRIIRGDSSANVGMKRAIEKMKRTRAAFLDAAKPYTHSGRKVANG